MPPEIAFVIGIAAGTGMSIAYYEFIDTARQYGDRILKAARGNIYHADNHVADAEAKLKALFAGVKRAI